MEIRVLLEVGDIVEVDDNLWLRDDMEI